MTQSTRPVYPRYGAHAAADGAVSFSLFAPRHARVELVGDFNRWTPGADLLRGDTEGRWAIHKLLAPGSYRYQYIVDGVLICDPYATAIDNAVEPPRALLEVGREPYRWQHDGWGRHPFNDLVLYEMHVGDFSPEGTFDGVVRRLDHLRGLGVTAIELMPVTQGGANDHWGYEPAYFFAVNKAYGSADDFRRLVDEAHARRIAVVADIVLAHTAHEHPFTRLYPEHASPWYGDGIGGQNEFGFPTLDHRKPAARAFATDVQAYWLQEFHVDGFRYDYVKNIGYRDEEGAVCLVRAARAILPDAYLIGEHLPEEPRKTTTVDFDGVWHARTSRGLKALLFEREVDRYTWDPFTDTLCIFDPVINRYPRASWMIHYLVSHDEDRTANELKGLGFSPEDVQRKLILGATVLFTVGGEPLFLQGEEWGEDAPHNRKANPIHWDRLETDRGRALCRHYSALAALRRDRPAIRSENYRLVAADNNAKTMVFHRWDGRGDDVVVAANFLGKPQTVYVPFPDPGPWRDYFGNAEASENAELPPYSAAVYVRAGGKAGARS